MLTQTKWFIWDGPATFEATAVRFNIIDTYCAYRMFLTWNWIQHDPDPEQRYPWDLDWRNDAEVIDLGNFNLTVRRLLHQLEVA